MSHIQTTVTLEIPPRVHQHSQRHILFLLWQTVVKESSRRTQCADRSWFSSPVGFGAELFLDTLSQL